MTPCTGPRLAIGLAIALVAIGLRFAWPDWDRGHNLHPDERFLAMVAAAVELPAGVGEYLDSARSPLNPANRGFSFYVYGDLPLLLVRASGESLDAVVTSVCGAGPPPPGAAGGDPSLVDRLCWPGGARRQPVSLDGLTRVGRFLSALADLATIAWLFVLGRLLWGEGTGAVAAALGAVTVLHVQQAHFATVDAIATQLAIVALTLAVAAARAGRGPVLLATGIAAGLAAACRINLAPAVGLVPLAVVASLAGGRRRAGGFGRTAILAWGGLGLVAALVAFRLAMPYAFAGVVTFDPVWLEGIDRMRHMMSGAADGGPPGVQWLGRTPLVFALRNLVVWGMGLPLGITVLAAWAILLATRLQSIWRDGDGAGAVPLLDPVAIVWLWPTLMVGWFGAQRVMSMRYLLPAYPALIVLGAWLLTRPWTRPVAAAGRWRLVARAALPVVLGATALWAWAFTAVYRSPHPRIAASRWIYDMVPREPRLVAVSDDAGVTVELTMTPLVVGSRRPALLSFCPEQDVRLTELVLPDVDVVAADGSRGAGWVRVRIAPAPDGRAALIDAAVATGSATAVRVGLGNVRIASGDWTFVVLSALDPALSAVLGRPTIAGEHWDDQLPLALDGHDPSRLFDLIQLESFNPDTPAKRDHLLARLTAADFIALSSNRVYASIPRDPARWPLTTRFYRLLLAGRLGFETAAEFTSYPRLGRIVFPDCETTGALGLAPDPSRVARPAGWRVPLPPAEEAFSVYDHPRVVILRKTADFDPIAVAAALGG